MRGSSIEYDIVALPVGIASLIDSIPFIYMASLSSASAMIDPMISIDPTWAAANPGYSLRFSTNVGGLAEPVPEPSTWAILLLGFFGIVFSMRGVRRKSAGALA